MPTLFVYAVTIAGAFIGYWLQTRLEANDQINITLPSPFRESSEEGWILHESPARG
jgi:hypothetical protein